MQTNQIVEEVILSIAWLGLRQSIVDGPDQTSVGRVIANDFSDKIREVRRDDRLDGKHQVWPAGRNLALQDIRGFRLNLRSRIPRRARLTGASGHGRRYREGKGSH